MLGQYSHTKTRSQVWLIFSSSFFIVSIQKRGKKDKEGA